MKYSTEFAKLRQDGTLEYAPIPLEVVTHHHEEWDEPVIDPETGEPTGGTEHKSRDWDTVERKVFPKAADFRQMGYLRATDKLPSEPAPIGYHYEPISWTEFNDAIRRVYAPVQDPPPPPKVYSVNWLIYALMERDVYEQCRQWMEEAGLRDLVLTQGTFTADTEKFDEIKKGLQKLLGYTDEQVAEVLAEAEVG